MGSADEKAMSSGSIDWSVGFTRFTDYYFYNLLVQAGVLYKTGLFSLTSPSLLTLTTSCFESDPPCPCFP